MTLVESVKNHNRHLTAIVRNEKLSFSQLRIGDVAHIYDNYDEFLGLVEITKDPYLNDEKFWAIEVDVFDWVLFDGFK